MNVRSIIVLLWILSFLFCQCGRKKSEEKKEEIIEMTTARTLGLAYLEENKLEEAEEQFLLLISLAPEEAIGYANLGLTYLRMGKYEEAEKQYLKAIELDPDDPDIRLNLAKVYEMSHEAEKSIEVLEESIEVDPDHVQTLYSLAESYGGSTDKYSMDQWEKYLVKAVEAAPANIVPRLHLIEVLLRNGKPDKALSHLEEIKSLYPESPNDAAAYYQSALESLHASDTEEALTNVLIYHNFLKLTNPYQSGIAQVKGSTGSSVGIPVVTFSEAAQVFLQEGESILDALRFTDVTASAGLDAVPFRKSTTRETVESPITHMAVGDMDHDGDQDLYLGSYMDDSSGYQRYLFKCDMGRFTDVTSEAGIMHEGVESYAHFADYDNDGFLDLYVIAEGSNILYRSVSEGRYQDVTRESVLEHSEYGKTALFFDMDHEGDLDLFVAGSGPNQLFRNNTDGTYSELSSQTGLAGGNYKSRDACFGDFDDDGDIDLFVVNEDAGNTLYTNLRGGKFKDFTQESGLTGMLRSNSATSGDYNNDGYLDLFITGLDGGAFQLLMNQGNGTFTKDNQSPEFYGALENSVGYDASFLDFDNDGFLDLLIAGESLIPEESGLLLFHNDGSGNFQDVSHLLPDDLTHGRQIATFDYNEDGDTDIFIAGLNGGVRLLRNDGGNANHRLKIRLVGVRAGSGKNNYYGIGAKVEVRAGELYQMKVVTEPDMQFGLAQRSHADVVRILWTNGTAQNIFSPGSDQDLIEEQQLKGSCPFLYTWNGNEYVFVKDIMWHSALGMPMGIMGEQPSFAFPDASRDYYKIPGELLIPKEGKYSIQITEELWETIYLDEVELIVVDHPDSVDVFVDERFSPPPYPEHKIYPVSDKHPPRSALDGEGNDLLPLISDKDERYISSFAKGPYQGITGMSDLILDPGVISQTGSLLLIMNGWIYPTDASINAAISQSGNMEVVPPFLQVMNKKGEWETIMTDLGFPAGKNKTLITDLTGIYLSEGHRVRIRTNMEIYWDQIYFAPSPSSIPVRSIRLKPLAADHHYRGFSRLYRKGGRYGPHWFDYSSTSILPKWRDLTGTYTRYGDVHKLLKASDNMYIIANAGEETTVEFDASTLAPLPEDWTRDFLIYTVGWVKDGDLNTATGQTAEPLPFHGMTRYPYGKEESYPSDPEHLEYLKTYNTRVVTTTRFRRAIADTK